METNTRDRSIDILKGIGILLVVFNHVSWGKEVFIYIQSFHMPLFFVVSGYLWKPKSTKDILKKRAKTLLMPYYIFMVFFLLIEVTLHLEDGMTIDIMQALRAIVLFPTDNANMPIASAMWFLPCLFLVSVIYSFLDIFKFETKAVIVLLISVCGAVYSHFFDYMLPLTLEPTAAALFFMLMGEYIKKNCPYETFLSKKLFIIGLLLIEAALAFVNGSVDLRSARFHIAPLYFINGILGTIVYFGIAKCIVAFQSRLGGGYSRTN